MFRLLGQYQLNYVSVGQKTTFHTAQLTNYHLGPKFHVPQIHQVTGTQLIDCLKILFSGGRPSHNIFVSFHWKSAKSGLDKMSLVFLYKNMGIALPPLLNKVPNFQGCPQPSNNIKCHQYVKLGA